MASAAPEIPSLARDRAFENLYRCYAQDVYRYALALLRNPADAEDVTQTTFMNAYRALSRGEQVDKPQNWLIKIAHNAARTRYARASRRVKEVPLDDHIERLALADEDKPDVREVLDALGLLPMNQRAALVMRELEGRTYAEIADMLDVSVPAVETLIFRARRSLRLKASAIRVLGIVPLPTSLSQLFETGGLVAGGGAVAGSGFLLKAAVVVVVGAVATGVGGDRSPGAAVGRVSPNALQALHSSGSGQQWLTFPAALRVGRSVGDLAGGAGRTAKAADSRTSRAGQDGGQTFSTAIALAGLSSSSGGTSSSTTSSGSAILSRPTGQLTDAVTAVTDAVTAVTDAATPLTNAVTAVTNAVSTTTLPVTVSLPHVTTTVPLPPTPTVPSLP
jgi:RNA polymerase sigma factor (sigma-70 family)